MRSSVLARRTSARSMWSTSKSLQGATSNSRTRGAHPVRDRCHRVCTPQFDIDPTNSGEQEKNVLSLCKHRQYRRRPTRPEPATSHGCAGILLCTTPKMNTICNGLPIYNQMIVVLPSRQSASDLPTPTSTGPTHPHCRGHHILPTQQGRDSLPERHPRDVKGIAAAHRLTDP